MYANGSKAHESRGLCVGLRHMLVHVYEWVMVHVYEWVMVHVYEWVMVHVYEWVMVHVYEWVIRRLYETECTHGAGYMCVSLGTSVSESWRTCMSVCHGAHVWDWMHTRYRVYVCVFRHISERVLERMCECFRPETFTHERGTSVSESMSA